MNSLFRNSCLFLKNAISNTNSTNKNLLTTLKNLNSALTSSSAAVSKKPAQNLVSNESNEIKSVFNNVNNAIKNPMHSRLFAVVQLGGSQFKITTEDIILVKNHFYPTIGDKIRLEKVLLVGGKDFTVIGKPMLSQEFVKIEATVIEKTLSNNVIVFRYKPRKNNRRMDFHKGVQTLLRINSIDIIGPVPGSK